MKQQTIGFLGAGNMASSLIAGLVADGYAASNITASDSDPAKLAELARRYGIATTADNRELVERSQILVLAVKPQVLQVVAREIADAVQKKKPLVISLAAGIAERDIERWLGGEVDLVRCMPNTPALVKTGATALHGSERISAEQRSRAEAVLRAVGLAVWVEREELLDAVTALSGSGPAYYFLLMEAMEEAAIRLGLEAETARLLTQQTALGAARLAIESDESPAELRKRVTSPHGTTEKAIASFESGNFRGLVLAAMEAARNRAGELSRELGGDA
ncbi:pyrroline-5-carboxylate reductase [Methylococcus sp. EFPC2]|uniref:pyrroline-5-carboxylate reductase n=1 Tax=Methylococcus sp. EFPC2 TaxID=2812648 RepID=UPI0019683F07|nr:pyrroline-5-carboxylate reductase [Methylococcus sp. EFPC2]QSA96153.1 pyrroline-5-carboxylate reductase [Methylococcus sp. EFPC2]